MFATVELYERDNSLKGRIRSLFKKSEIITERVDLPESEYFYKLKVPVHKGKIPIERLGKISEHITDGLIFPDGFSDEGELKRYSPYFFKELVLFNSAVSQIEKSVFNPSETLITLIDKKGVLHSHIDRLVCLAGEIKIITDNVKCYERKAKKIMEEYGLSLIVSDKLSAIPERGIIISLRSDAVPVYFKGLLITGEKRLLPFAKVLTGEGIKAREEYMSLCPKNINMTEFLSALCEVCFQKQLRESRYEKLVDISL